MPARVAFHPDPDVVTEVRDEDPEEPAEEGPSASDVVHRMSRLADVMAQQLRLLREIPRTMPHERRIRQRQSVPRLAAVPMPHLTDRDHGLDVATPARQAPAVRLRFRATTIEPVVPPAPPKSDSVEVAKPTMKRRTAAPVVPALRFTADSLRRQESADMISTPGSAASALDGGGGHRSHFTNMCDEYDMNLNEMETGEDPSAEGSPSSFRRDDGRRAAGTPTLSARRIAVTPRWTTTVKRPADAHLPGNAPNLLAPGRADDTQQADEGAPGESSSGTTLQRPATAGGTEVDYSEFPIVDEDGYHLVMLPGVPRLPPAEESDIEMNAIIFACSPPKKE